MNTHILFDDCEGNVWVYPRSRVFMEANDQKTQFFVCGHLVSESVYDQVLGSLDIVACVDLSDETEEIY